VCGFCGADLRGLGDAGETLVGTKAPGPGGAWMPGTLIDGRYRLKEKLGEGGMGAVYKAEHVRMGKTVALKLLRADAALDRTALKRFQQEARIVSRLTHPNTVSVFDFGEADDGTLYMAMEYVPGRDLAMLLEEEGAVPERRAVAITAQVLRSLAEAHEAGVVHRDVKPANVMVQRTREGLDFVKVVDFGIAKMAEAARGKPKQATTGRADIVGTPHYMSPEQVRGEALDGRSDLYSVGAMLFELLTGRSLFGDDTPLVVASRHLTEPPPSPSEVAPDKAFSPLLEEVLKRALAKKPEDRFQSADEMRAALAQALSSRPEARGPGLPDELDALSLGAEAEILQREEWDAFERRLRRRRRLKPLAACLALGLAAVGAWRLLASPGEASRSPVSEEVEPNDGPLTANLIEPGTTVRGFVKRAARERPDYDLFEFEVAGFEPLLAKISVSGVPNVNLAVDLFAFEKADGDRAELPNLGSVDDRFLGGAEAMTDLVLGPGRYLVRVADKRRADEPDATPRENTLDPYELRVELKALARFYEREPNNSIEQAMRISAARPVFGHAGARGEAARVQTPSGELARRAGLWSEDFFELALAKGASVGCALVSGVPGAVLSLSVVSTDHERLPAIADSAERQRALSQHLTALARQRPSKAPAGEVASACAKSTGSIVFKVAVDEGSSDARYVLVGLDDSDEGTAGVDAACQQLEPEGQQAVCEALRKEALRRLPRRKPSVALEGLE
jgi:tRNA A-37 threonylcarbamoyl transferase component Bud32